MFVLLGCFCFCVVFLFRFVGWFLAIRVVYFHRKAVKFVVVTLVMMGTRFSCRGDLFLSEAVMGCHYPREQLQPARKKKSALPKYHHKKSILCVTDNFLFASACVIFPLGKFLGKPNKFLKPTSCRMSVKCCDGTLQKCCVY